MASTETKVEKTDPAYTGQASYTPAALRIYDGFTYRFNYPFLWRCTSQQLFQLYKKNVSSRHLDIGVATGYLIDHCDFPTPRPQVTLMDLNSNSLAFAARRLQRYGPATHQANVLEPWGLPDGSFDSIGMFNLLHCLPGAMSEKAMAFKHARTALAPGGRLFGATVLGAGVKKNPLARFGLSVLNGRGAFHNRSDSPEELDAALAQNFDSYELTVKGMVGLFSARAEG